MVVEVLGRGQISFANVEYEDFREALSMMENNPEAFTISDYDEVNYIIYFEMGGNKGIDYQPLDEIRKYLLEKNARFQMSVVEYVEGETGFFFETEQEE